MRISSKQGKGKSHNLFAGRKKKKKASVASSSDPERRVLRGLFEKAREKEGRSLLAKGKKLLGSRERAESPPKLVIKMGLC